ncbi:MAG: HIT domain-containing protein [Gammaproteobacteria bacterium]|nr:HIT domain-containing protein [Gammaproteobacteria bacterium]
MYVELLYKEEEDGFIRALQFRVVAERVFDSPLHILPSLITLLVKKSLSSYAIHFVLNAYGRFDLEINSEYPEVNNNLLSMNLRKKVGRLHRLFYEMPLEAVEQIDYDDFVHELSMYEPRYMSLDDAALFGYSVQWHGLLETYRFLHSEEIDEDEFYHYILSRTDERWVSPAMNQKPCPFDRPLFLEEQVISGFEHFFLCLNYRPLGDSPFHLMIVPYQHETDLTHISPAYLFELEALLRATLNLWDGDRDQLFIYMQKHAQSGMTVPHMHIHVLCPSKNQPFREDIIQQLRYFASLMAGREEEAHTLARSPLSSDVMKQKIWRFESPIKKHFAAELRVQQQRYAQLHFSRVPLLKSVYFKTRGARLNVHRQKRTKRSR